MKKKLIRILLILFFLMILLPIEVGHVKDGGSVVYKGLIYTVKKVHSFKSTPPEEEQQFYEGIVIKIFNVEIFNNVK